MRLFRFLSIVLLGTGLLGLPGGSELKAARDTQATGTSERMELLVLEIKGCNICSLVRTHIQPAYERSPRARGMPMRYVDVTELDETKLGLKAPIDTVPTIVLMRNGKEVDRIAGYVGPEMFFNVLTHMMQNAAD
ncbi:MAG: thioredoxin family protein [Hyphomicrobiaceae bacterium]